MKNILFSYHTSYLLLFVCLFSGCIHEYPDDEGIEPVALCLQLTLPDPNLPDYVSIRSLRSTATGFDLRGVVEVLRKGTEERVCYRQAALTPLNDGSGRYQSDIDLIKGDYDLRLWADYVPAGTTNDYHYLTGEGLKFVTLAPDPYRANTGSKDAFYAFATLSLTENRQEEISLKRPLAKYQLVATDVQQYRQLMQSEGYPPLEELTVSVHYEGFLPNSFNVVTGAPNDAATGISYTVALPAGVAESVEKVQLASDWVLVNGGDTFVTVTVRITDSDGNVVNQSSGIRIDYRRGYLTTVSGKFLTASITGGNINIDTEWGDDIIIEF